MQKKKRSHRHHVIAIHFSCQYWESTLTKAGSDQAHTIVHLSLGT